jgi:uncharacterized protein YutE (UPF0331/DUF86 family)
MHDKPIRNDTAHIYCSVTTRDLVRGLKRGGETYDEVLRRMAEQYNPTANRGVEGTDDGA